MDEREKIFRERFVEMENMKWELFQKMYDFVMKAMSEKATPEETKAMSEVAKTLLTVNQGDLLMFP